MHWGGSVGVHLALIPQGKRSQGSEEGNYKINIKQFFYENNQILTFAFISIGSVEEERWRADTLSRLDALLIGSAFLIGTASPLSWGTQAMMRVATVSIRADTIISSRSVVTVRSISAHLASLRTLINVGTGAIGLRAISLGTSAVAESSCDGDAFGSLGALASLITSRQDTLAADKLIRGLALALHTTALLAAHIRVAVESRGAMALITARQILAERISSTRLLSILRALVHIAALLRRFIADEPLSADADIRSQIGILDTCLSRGTRMIIAAGNVNDIILGTTIAVGISRTASRALAGITSRAIRAHRSTRAGISCALINVYTGSAVLRRGTGESLSTQALCYVIDNHTLGVRGTAHGLARVTAVIADIWLGTETPLVLITNGVSRALCV